MIHQIEQYTTGAKSPPSDQHGDAGKGQAKAHEPPVSAPLVPPTDSATFVPSFSESARALGVAQAKGDADAIAHWTAVVAAFEAAAKAALNQKPLVVDHQAWNRENLGRLVRDEWMDWALEQDNPKPSWLTPWSLLSEPDREVDRRIGERIAKCVEHHLRMTSDAIPRHPDAIAERVGDMGEGTKLQLYREDDGDFIVSVMFERFRLPDMQVQFCVPGSGGGSSPATWDALCRLHAAMHQDGGQ